MPAVLIGLLAGVNAVLMELALWVAVLVGLALGGFVWGIALRRKNGCRDSILWPALMVLVAILLVFPILFVMEIL